MLGSAMVGVIQMNIVIAGALHTGRNLVTHIHALTLKNMCICRAGRHGFVILNAVLRVGEGFKYVLDLVTATGIQTTTIGARDRQ